MSEKRKANPGDEVFVCVLAKDKVVRVVGPAPIHKVVEEDSVSLPEYHFDGSKPHGFSGEYYEDKIHLDHDTALRAAGVDQEAVFASMEKEFGAANHGGALFQRTTQVKKG